MQRPIDTAPQTGEFITLMWMEGDILCSTIGRRVAYPKAPSMDHWGDEIKLDWGLSPTRCNPTHWDYITEGPALERFGFNAAKPTSDKDHLHHFMQGEPMDDISTMLGVPDDDMNETELRWCLRFAVKQLNDLHGRKIS